MNFLMLDYPFLFIIIRKHRYGSGKKLLATSQTTLNGRCINYINLTFVCIWVLLISITKWLHKTYIITIKWYNIWLNHIYRNLGYLLKSHIYHIFTIGIKSKTRLIEKPEIIFYNIWIIFTSICFIYCNVYNDR